jgi:uncharacterized membrane protein
LIGLPIAGLAAGAVVTAIAARAHDSGLRDADVAAAVRAASPGTAVLVLLGDPADRSLITAGLTGTAAVPPSTTHTPATTPGP